MSTMFDITPAIMIGGSGSRLWPLSRSDRPKQFLHLGGRGSMFQDTVSRFAAPGFRPAWLLGNTTTLPLVEAQLAEAALTVDGIVVEPAMRGTAAAIATIALIRAEVDPDELVLVVPSDHFIADEAQFRARVLAAASVAAGGAIVTFGIAPTAPETGFGYIAAGAPISVDEDVLGYHIPSGGFREKPDLARAAEYVAAGCVWNAGIFLFRAATMLDELRRHAPKTLGAVERAVRAGERKIASGCTLLLPEGTAFLDAPPELSIDVAVMERTDRAVVVPCAGIGWNDVGSLSALHEITAKSEDGNVTRGDALLLGCKECLVRADGGRKVVAAHLSNMIIVDTEDALIVLPADQAQSVKTIVAQLKAQSAPELTDSRHAAFAWGEAHLGARGSDHLTLDVRIDAAHRITRHCCQSLFETWVVTGGAISVDLLGRLTLLEAGQCFSIGRGDLVSLVAVNAEARLAIVTAAASPLDLCKFFAVEPGTTQRNVLPPRRWTGVA